MKKVVVILAVCSILVGALAVAGCGGSTGSTPSTGGSTGSTPSTGGSATTEVGKYVNKAITGDYIELRPNGTFTFVKGGQLTTGSYAIVERAGVEELILNTAVMTMSGNTLTDSDGTKYDKQ